MGYLLLLMIIWGVISGVAASTIAEHQGRDDGKAFLLGFFFSWTALAVYIALGKTLEKQAEDAKKLTELMEAAEE